MQDLKIRRFRKHFKHIGYKDIHIKLCEKYIPDGVRFYRVEGVDPMTESKVSAYFYMSGWSFCIYRGIPSSECPDSNIDLFL